MGRDRGGTAIDPLVSDTSVPALVLKVGTYPLHHGGLGVVRSLGRLGIPVYGVYEERFAPAAVSRHLSGKFVWRCEPSDPDRFLEGMATVGERLGRPAVLIPTDDLGAILISEHAPALERWFRFPQPPPGLAHLLASKKGPVRALRQARGPLPAGVVPDLPPRRAGVRRQRHLPGGGQGGRGLAAAGGRQAAEHHHRPGPRQPARPLRPAGRRAGQQPHAPGVHPARVRPGLVLPRLLRRPLGVPGQLHRGEAALVPALCGTDDARPLPRQPGPAGQRRGAAAGHLLPGDHGPRLPPGPPRRRVQAARLQPAGGRPVPRVRGRRRASTSCGPCTWT